MTECKFSQQLFSSYAKFFMKAKMGRPKVPKAKLREIIIQARVSKEENRVIQAAMAASPEGKGDWIRKALLSAAGSDKPAS